jgi:hypothetical protein
VKNIYIKIIVIAILASRCDVFSGDSEYALSAVDAYASLLDSERVSATIKSEEEWSMLIQGYIERFGYEFIFEAVRNYRGKEDVKKSEQYALITRYTLAKILEMMDDSEALLDALISLYESDPDEVLRNVSIPFALSGIFYDYDRGKFSLSPGASMLKQRQEDLPMQFIAGYMYKHPIEAVLLMADVFGTDGDKRMLEELTAGISSLWRSQYWPYDVTTFAQATQRAQELLLSISDRNEWWIHLFIQKVLEENPEWSTAALEKFWGTSIMPEAKSKPETLVAVKTNSAARPSSVVENTQREPPGSGASAEPGKQTSKRGVWLAGLFAAAVAIGFVFLHWKRQTG